MGVVISLSRAVKPVHGYTTMSVKPDTRLLLQLTLVGLLTAPTYPG